MKTTLLGQSYAFISLIMLRKITLKTNKNSKVFTVAIYLDLNVIFCMELSNNSFYLLVPTKLG